MAEYRNKKRICIVTTRHISYNPRVVKEADALTEAGYDVTVITINNHFAQRREDERMMASRKWHLTTVDYRRLGIQESFRWLWTGIRKKFFERVLSRLTFRYGIAERSQGREFTELSCLASHHPADLYIAHHPDTLGVVYQAAKKYNAMFAFDAEDFHTGEHPMDANFFRQSAIIEYLENKYLPHCDYVTAASENISKALSQKYSIPQPKTILNVFPLESQKPVSRNQYPETRKVSLYWYSQVIGPGRGLEQAVLAMNQLSIPCELHLRGTLINDFGEHLKRLANKSEIKKQKPKIYFHPPVPPEQLIQLAAEHDIGLALETGECLNRLLCVTNKLFVYMNAGLAIVATDTPGQKNIMNDAPETGIICKMTGAKSLADAIDSLISNPIKLENAKKASRQAAEKLFNWDIEKKKLIEIVGGVLGV